MLVALGAASLVLPRISPLQSPVGSATSLNPPSPLVLAHQPGGGGVQRVKVVEQEGEGRKWGFMAFLKEKRTEI